MKQLNGEYEEISITGKKFHSWYKNNLLHREDGPAIEWEDGQQQWWIEGVEYKEEEFNTYMKKKNLKDSLLSELNDSKIIVKKIKV